MEKTLQEMTESVVQFCTDRDWDQFHGPKDLAIGLVTESSELLQHFRFLDEQRAQDLLQDSDKREAVGEELADILFFLLRFSQRNKFDLTQAFYDKLQKNTAKYPIEKSKGRFEKYTDL
ncbi:MAG: nucleotide pyrophosphohydrolase [Pseudobdellovibrionaceae bacterium]|nr:nucleotide pyrophosphohydrolase [Bdellovibrionales bacterium]USN48553.1 MAG: nucleotide pyrophosphohydrolase [Pseudobdellovibrionaceae bacterium]